MFRRQIITVMVFALVVSTSSAQKMYWTGDFQKKLSRANLDGSNVETLIFEPADSPGGLALDVAAGKIYWVEWFYPQIRRSNLDGTHVEILLTDYSRPRRIALDPVVGKMYWTNNLNHQIRRANFDGTFPETIISNARFVEGIAIDQVARKLYWAERNAIKEANLNGTGMRTVADAGPMDLAFDPVGGMLYWSEPSPHKIRRCRQDGTGLEDFVTSETAYGLAVDSSARQLYWTGRTSADSDWIKRVNLDGSDEAMFLRRDVFNPQGIAVDSVGGLVYYSELGTSRIRRVSIDGSPVEEVIPSRTGVAGADGIALDSMEGKLYIADSVKGCIWSARLDGTTVGTALASLGRGSVQEIALDLEHRRIYFSYSDSRILFRSNMGSSASIQISTQRFWDLEVDAHSGHLYWPSSLGVIRGNLDAQILDILVPPPSTEVVRSVSLDIEGGRIYWIQAPFGQPQVTFRSADLNGGNPRILMSANESGDFQVDPASEHIYWVGRGSIANTYAIRRSSMNGQVHQVLVDGLKRVESLMLDLRTTGDFDNDASVDLRDFARFQNCFGPTSLDSRDFVCPFFDVEFPSQHIDGVDLQTFLANYSE